MAQQNFLVWWFGTFFNFSVCWEWKIIPTDELTPSFFRGVEINHQPDVSWVYLKTVP